MEHARTHLMHLLQQKDPELERCDIAGDRAYRTESDAVRLLRKVDAAYEPLPLSALLRKKAARHSVRLTRRWAHQYQLRERRQKTAFFFLSLRALFLFVPLFLFRFPSYHHEVFLCRAIRFQSAVGS